EVEGVEAARQAAGVPERAARAERSQRSGRAGVEDRDRSELSRGQGVGVGVGDRGGDGEGGQGGRRHRQTGSFQHWVVSFRFGPAACPAKGSNAGARLTGPSTVVL